MVSAERPIRSEGTGNLAALGVARGREVASSGIQRAAKATRNQHSFVNQQNLNKIYIF